jgi:hypothetical protein
MLNDHTIGQVAYQHLAQREGEAEAHGLVLEARRSRQRHVWRRELARELQRLPALVAAPSMRAGTSC